MTRHGITALLVLAGSGYAARRLWTALLPLATLHSPAGLVEALVSNAVLIAGAVTAAWYFLTALAVLVSTLGRGFGASVTGLERMILRFGAPLLRRAVALTAATTLALATPSWADEPDRTPAEATESTASASSSTPAGRNAAFLVDLGWVPTPNLGAESNPAADSPAAPGNRQAALALAQPARAQTEQERPAPKSYTVRPGDSLWTIAANHLGAGSSPPSAQAIAAEWPRWYLANSGIIGPDPNLIHPGMTLIPPQPKEAP